VIIQNTKTEPRSPGGVYLFTGEDDFRKQLSLDKLKTKLLGANPDILNYESYYGKQASAREIIGSLESITLTGTKKLVVLKDPESMPESEKAGLIAYLKRHDNSNSVFVLFSRSLPLKNDKLSTALLKHARVIDFEKLGQDEMLPWIVKEFKARKKRIDNQGARLIFEAAQGEAGCALSTIEQVSVFTGSRETVTEDDIAAFCQAPPEGSTFKLLDSINDKDTKSALRILSRLLGSGNTPFQIVGLLSWHILRLITVKRMLAKRVSKEAMSSYLKLGSYVLSRLIPQAQNFSAGELRGHLNAVLETDLMLKRSPVKAGTMLEMLVAKLSS